jgi:hypothetical protein
LGFQFELQNSSQAIQKRLPLGKVIGQPSRKWLSPFNPVRSDEYKVTMKNILRSLGPLML